MKKYIRAKWNRVKRTMGVMVLVAFSLYGYAQDEFYQLKSGHPRIIMTKYDELAVRFAFLEDSLAVQFRDELKRDADIFLNEKLVNIGKNANSVLEPGRIYLNRILTLSLAYRIFDEDIYSDKAIELMRHLCDLDWNPEYFEGAATITAALAIGYDWNFYHLNGFDREVIRNTIVEKGLNPGIEKYDILASEERKHSAIKGGKNVIEVVGLALGALAIGEDFPQLKNKVLYNVVSCIVTTLNKNNPNDLWVVDGYNKEIVNNYLTMLMSSLNTSLGHDFGISAKGSLLESIQGYVEGTASSEDTLITPSLLWYSKNDIMVGKEKRFKTQLRSSLNPTTMSSYKKDHLFYLNMAWYN